MVEWNRNDRGSNRRSRFTTSYGDPDGRGDTNANSDWDGKSCSDYHQLPGRGTDCEDLTMLQGLVLNEIDSEERKP